MSYEDFWKLSEKFVERVNSMPEAIEEMEEYDTVLQFSPTDSDKGAYLIFKNQKCELHEGEHPNPVVSYFADLETFIRILNGDVDPTKLYFAGELKIKGKLADALRFRAIADIVIPKKEE